MKKKIYVLLLALVMALTCTACLVACGNSNIEGTYYAYAEGQLQKSEYMTLSDGKVKVGMGMEGTDASMEGTYKVDGKVITVTVTVMGVSTTQKLTLVADGVLAVDGIEGAYYCKEGKTPPAEEKEE